MHRRSGDNCDEQQGLHGLPRVQLDVCVICGALLSPRATDATDATAASAEKRREGENRVVDRRAKSEDRENIGPRMELKVVLTFISASCSRADSTSTNSLPAALDTLESATLEAAKCPDGSLAITHVAQ